MCNGFIFFGDRARGFTNNFKEAKLIKRTDKVLWAIRSLCYVLLFIFQQIILIYFMGLIRRIVLEDQDSLNMYYIFARA